MRVVTIALECGHKTAAVQWPGYDPNKGSRYCGQCSQGRRVIPEWWCYTHDRKPTPECWNSVDWPPHLCDIREPA